MIDTTINTNGLLEKQIPHVKRLVDSLHLNGFAFDPSDTGCGKTYSACATARELNVPVFVICPTVVIPSWENVLSKFGIKPVGVKNYEGLIRGNANSKYTSWIKEPTNKLDSNGSFVMEEKLRFNKKIPKNALIIFDEVHKCKALDSTSSELLISATQQGFKVLSLSASAATNPIEMKALGYHTRIHQITDHNEFKRTFAKQYGAEWRSEYGGMSFDPTSDKAKEAMKAIHTYLYKTTECASRLTKEDMKDHFGENHIVADSFDCGKTNTTKINRVYDQMEYELSQLEEKSSNYSSHIFAVMMKARRLSELLKVPTYVDEVEQHIRDNKSVALFLNFNESIDSAVKRLEKKYSTKTSIKEFGEVKVVTVRGGQTKTERQENIDLFQSDGARIIICNMAAGGVGISLHDITGKHGRVSLISPNFSAIQLCQALGRIHRAEAKSDAFQKVIFAAKTIEESACEKVQYRLNNLSLLNDGDLTNGIKFYGQVEFDK